MRKAIQFVKKISGDKPLFGAEIGVEKGEHSLQILQSLNIKLLYCIDSWIEFKQCGTSWWVNGLDETLYQMACDNLEGFQNVNIIRKSSLEAVKLFQNNSLDFVYVDANHQYEFVKADIIAWYPKVRKGGVLSGHDYCDIWSGVKQAVNEFSQEFNVEFDHDHSDDTAIDDWWILC